MRSVITLMIMAIGIIAISFVRSLNLTNQHIDYEHARLHMHIPYVYIVRDRVQEDSICISRKDTFLVRNGLHTIAPPVYKRDIKDYISRLDQVDSLRTIRLYWEE